jgi:hypothetical protein
MDASAANSQAPEGNLFFLGDIEVECVVNSRDKTFAPPSMHRSRAYTESGKIIGATKYGALLAEASTAPSPKGSYFTCVLPHFAKPKTPRERAAITRQRVLEGFKQDGVALKQAHRGGSADEDPSPSQLETLVEVSAAAAPAPRVYAPHELAETNLAACMPTERDRFIAQLNPTRTSMPPPLPRSPSAPKRKSVAPAAAAPVSAKAPRREAAPVSRKKPRTTTTNKVTTTNTITITEEGDRRTTSNTVTTVTEDVAAEPSSPDAAVSVPSTPTQPQQQQQQQQELDLTDFMGDPIEDLRLQPPSPGTFQAMHSYYLSPTGSSSPRYSPRNTPTTPSSAFPGYSQNPYQPPHAPAPTALESSAQSPRPQSPSASPSRWIDAFPSPAGVSSSPALTGPLTPSDVGRDGGSGSGFRLDSTSLAMMRTYMDMQS